MPKIATFDVGDRIYGRATLTRSDWETDAVTGTTATVTLVDPDNTQIPVIPVVTTPTVTTVQVDWEYTPATPPPGVWWAVVRTGTALVAADEAPFRVTRSHVTV